MTHLCFMIHFRHRVWRNTLQPEHIILVFFSLYLHLPCFVLETDTCSICIFIWTWWPLGPASEGLRTGALENKNLTTVRVNSSWTNFVSGTSLWISHAAMRNMLKIWKRIGKYHFLDRIEGLYWAMKRSIRSTPPMDLLYDWIILGCWTWIFFRSATLHRSTYTTGSSLS